MNIIYPGYGQPPKFASAIADSLEARHEALAKGATAFTTMSFEYEPQKNKPEPKRYGPLFLDFDCKEKPQRAISDALRFADMLQSCYAVPQAMLRFWLSGNKGCHIAIHERIYGCSGGHSYLPIIYRNMVFGLCLYGQMTSQFPTVDRSLYPMGKGKLLRVENVLRSNGKYKVPVTYAELRTLSYADLELLTAQPRFLPEEARGIAPELTPLENEYSFSLQQHRDGVQKTTNDYRAESCEECVFISHCRDNVATLSEPEWFAMISNLARLGKKGIDLIHEYSRSYPDYSKKKTEQKIHHALTLGRPHSCKSIKEFFDCGKDCGIPAPVEAYQKRGRPHDVGKRSIQYKLLDNGLYYMPDTECLPWRMEKICTRIEVTAKTRNPDGSGWGRFCTITAPDGQQRDLYFSMAELTQSSDSLRGRLMDHGLELEPGNQNKTRLIEYLQIIDPGRYVYQVDNLGWHENVFVLPDQTFGHVRDAEYRYQDRQTRTVFGVSGTCAEWQEQIGRFCTDNPLFLLACSFAFTGPLLRPCNAEGGGLHIHGASSMGKTTVLNVAGSICGGGPAHGFKLTWRSTSNALESVAVQHNDNLLCLDEIGEAGPNVVNETAYMLANGQGRGRADRSGMARKRQSWTLSFMSTGELTLNDKIRQDGARTTAMAGQLVRVLDIPADAEQGLGVFCTLHGFPSGNELSQHLNGNALKTYGAPLRCFLDKLTEDQDASLKYIRSVAYHFQAKMKPEGCSSQVGRVCGRFALIAAAGELAIRHQVLPCPKGAAYAAACLYFRRWLDIRGGMGDMEVEMAFNRLKTLMELHAENRFITIDSTDDRQWLPHNLAGYKWRQDGKWCYLVLSSVARDEVYQTCAPRRLRDRLHQGGHCLLTSAGTIMETKSVPNQGNTRGLIVVPETWKEVEAPAADSSAHRKTHTQDDIAPSSTSSNDLFE